MIWVWLILSILMVPCYKGFFKAAEQDRVSDIIKEAEDILRRSNGGKNDVK